MITNSESSPDTSDDESMTTSMAEESLQGTFNKNFEVLRQIYKKQTGKDLPQPDSFDNESTLMVRGQQKTVHSSVPMENVKSTSEGESRGMFVTSDDSIRYLYYTNEGDKPQDFNWYTLKVVKLSNDRGIIVEMRISTMSSERAAGIMTPTERMKRPKKRGRMMPRRRREENEDQDETYSADEADQAMTMETEPEEAESEE